jgi:hypothetical protein
MKVIGVGVLFQLFFQAFFNRRRVYMETLGGSRWQSQGRQAEGHSEPTHTTAPSSGCMLLLSCG